MRVADVGRARVHGDSRKKLKLNEVGEKSRDMNCGSGGQASKLAYAQAFKLDVRENDGWWVPRVGKFELTR